MPARIWADGKLRARAGSQALSLLSIPPNIHLLHALERGPRSLTDLRRVVGRPPETTLRGHLKALVEVNLLERHRRHDFPGSVDYELTRPGRELLEVAKVAQTWLDESPEGSQALGDLAAKSSIKALVEGWSATIVRALASGRLTLTELSELISILNYPSVERRLTAMRLAGLIKDVSNGRRNGTPYAATSWLRQGIAPLLAAIRWERHNLAGEAPPLGRTDVEAVFLLTVPLVALDEDQEGVCRFAVDLRNGAGESRPAGVLIAVSAGRVVSCVSRLEGEANAWSSGSASAWLHAIVGGETDGLEIGGDCSLVTAVLDQVHSRLFPSPAHL